MTASKRDSTYIEKAVGLRLHSDSHLTPCGECIRRRGIKVIETEIRIIGGRKRVAEFASGHEYYGMHYRDGRWIFREWAPNASAIFLKGDFSKWRAQDRFSLSRISDDGVWEIELPSDLLQHKDEYRLEMHWPGGFGDAFRPGRDG
jgi:1,4-alpha-glucan branching enzyme